MNLVKDSPIKIDKKKIWDFMEKRNLSQVKLAKLAMISPTTLFQILKTGEAKKYVTVFKIASALQTTIPDLVIE